MDLIYTDSNLIDQGVLQDYSFDMEYGIGEKDTNTFEIKIQKYNIAMQGAGRIDQDSIIYAEYTEYGGIVDRIESDTKTGVVTLSGRTWHGILNSFVLEPPKGAAYRTYDGDVNADVLPQMLADVGLNSFFVVDPPEEIGAIRIRGFQVRYENLYDAIMRMLTNEDDKIYGKLKCYYAEGQVHIAAMLAVNYTKNEEFDSSQVPFAAGKTFNNINHMICLGQGDGENRAVIHLFCDDYGVIQPYKLVDDPIRDEDYILDKQNQVKTGLEERAYIYDYPSAEITYNYPLLPRRPSDWETEYYNKYYVSETDADGNRRYVLIPRTEADVFKLLDHEPADWNVKEGYKNYYTCNASGTEGTSVEELQEDDPECVIEYLPAGGKVGKWWDWDTEWKEYYQPVGTSGEYAHPSGKTVTTSDNLLTKEPPDWAWNYGSYNYRTWNGIAWEYHAFQPEITYGYEPQTVAAPSDWATNFGNYYEKEKQFIKVGWVMGWVETGNYVTVSEAISKGYDWEADGVTYPEWIPDFYYNKVEVEKKAPPFPNEAYYDTQIQIAPDWQDNRYYKRVVNNTPKFKLPDPANGFYGYWELVEGVEQIPIWSPNKYHYQTIDRFKVLTEDAKKKFRELRDTSTLDISLELEAMYDVGDWVGGYDQVTKIEVSKPILRKIIKIKKDIVSIDYEVE